MNTILITGCSSGFGLETARLFLDRGWNVIATMRTPRPDLLPASERLRIIPLDVTKPDSIRNAVAAAGPIDVLVNNAGIGYFNAVESMPLDRVRDVFETNIFGTMAVTQAVVPQLRERRSGVIINVSSTVTLMSLPLLSAYTASKAAVNAFTECLAQELEPFDIRVRLVLPGRAPDTAFAENGRARLPTSFPDAYAGMIQSLFARLQEGGPVTYSSDVAEAVWQAATDPSCPLRLPAGADAVATAAAAA